MCRTEGGRDMVKGGALRRARFTFVEDWHALWTLTSSALQKNNGLGAEEAKEPFDVDLKDKR